MTRALKKKRKLSFFKRKPDTAGRSRVFYFVQKKA